MTNLNSQAKQFLFWYFLSGFAFFYVRFSYNWSLHDSFSLLFALTILPTYILGITLNYYYPFKKYGLAYCVIGTAIALAICKAVGVI